MFRLARNKSSIGRRALSATRIALEERNTICIDVVHSPFSSSFTSTRITSTTNEGENTERRRRTNNLACTSRRREFQTSAITEARPGQNRSPSGAGKPKKFKKNKLPPSSVGVTNQERDDRGGTKGKEKTPTGELGKSKQPYTSVYRKIKPVGKGTLRKKVERVVEKKEVKAKAAMERRHVRINELSTVNEIAKAFGIESEQIIKLLEALGDSTSLSTEESVAADSIELIAAELGDGHYHYQ